MIKIILHRMTEELGAKGQFFLSLAVCLIVVTAFFTGLNNVVVANTTAEAAYIFLSVGVLLITVDVLRNR